MTLSLLVLLALTPLAQNTIGLAEPAGQPTSRYTKIPVRYVLASDMAANFGGTTLYRRDAGLRPGQSPRGWPYGAAAALVPDGTESIIADDSDNTLIVVGSDEANREMRERVAMMDVRPRPIQVRARATLTLRDSAGKSRTLLVDAAGRTTTNRRMHVKSDSAESARAGAGPAPSRETSDLDVYVRLLPEDEVSLDADWYVDIAWPGKQNAPRIHQVFRSNGIVKSGVDMQVVRSTIKVAGGSAELVLVVTPRVLP